MVITAPWRKGLILNASDGMEQVNWEVRLNFGKK